MSTKLTYTVLISVVFLNCMLFTYTFERRGVLYVVEFSGYIVCVLLQLPHHGRRKHGELLFLLFSMAYIVFNLLTQMFRSVHVC